MKAGIQMSERGLFSEVKIWYARNQHKDVVTASGIFDRRAAKFRIGSQSSFAGNFAGSPPPAFATSYAKYRALYDFASEKRPLSDMHINNDGQDARLFKSFTILRRRTIFYK